MIQNVLRRLVISAALLLIVSVFVFTLIDLAPGDAALQIAGDNATPARVQEVRENLGFDDPLPVRYARWLGGAVQGDLGTSLGTREPVTDIIARRLPPTLSLVGLGLFISVSGALVAGVLAALRPGGLVDRSVTLLTALGIAVPGFWAALVLVSEFAVKRDFLPAVGYVSFFDDPVEAVRHLILPAIALSGVAAAELMRQLRGSLQDALRTDYVLAARAKGIRQGKLVMKHGLKNASIPVITVLGVRLAQLVGGTVILESIFNLNGIGQLIAGAVLARDIPVVLGVTMFTTLVVLLTNLLIEVTHPYFNPKVRT